MKDPFQVLRQKELDLQRVRTEIAVLQFVIPLLADDSDQIENAFAARRIPPKSTASQSPSASRPSQASASFS